MQQNKSVHKHHTLFEKYIGVLVLIILKSQAIMA